MNNIVFMNKKYKIIRNPNIDFLRILGMFAIIIHHLILHGRAINKYNKFKNNLHLLNIFCMWHVSSFGIISGLVGNKKHNYSNLLHLWILVVFYSIIIFNIYKKLAPIFHDNFSKNIFPVINGNYWYFTAYFGIYPFLNIIDIGIINSIQIELKKTIYFIVGIFIIWASYYRDKFKQSGGYSPFSLLNFYILGAYIGKYIFYKNLPISYKYLICIICFIIFSLISIICYLINIKNYFSEMDLHLKAVFRIGINSFPMLLQVISLTIFISQVKFNKYVSKIVTFLGPLTFDVYIIHENKYIRKNVIGKLFNNQKNHISLFNVYFSIYKKSFYLFNICIFIAYIRNLFFKFIKIKNICSNFESFISKLINYFI